MRRRPARPSRSLSSVYLKTLRGYRIPIVGWGYGMSLLVLELVASTAAITSSAAGRATLQQVAAQFSWNAAPIAVDTPGGYAMFKLGVAILVIAIWPILAATRTLRGEEESGALDVLLAMPESRTRVAAQKVGAIATAVLGMAVVIGVVTGVGGAVFKGGYGFGDALLFGLNLALIAAVFGAAALLISQFTSERRRAAGVAAGVLLVSAVLDMVHRIWPGTDWVSALSPVYYYNLSKPLAPGYGVTAWAMVVQLALAATLSGAALWLFARRDVSGTVPLPAWLRLPVRRAPRHALPVRELSLTSVYARAVRDSAWPAFWWTLAIAGFAAWMVVAVKQLAGSLQSLESTSSGVASVIGQLGGGNARAIATLLSAIFVLLPVLLMAFVVTQVNRWASDEEDGRLELVLATPQTRTGVLVARFAALTTMTIAVGVITLGATALSAALSGVSLDGGGLAAATLGMVPLGLLIAALGYAGAGWLRTSADTGLLSGLLALWFLLSFVGPELHWPDTLLRLSPFYYYGSPLLHGLQASVVIGFLAAGLVALSAGALRFSRKDIGG
ncbi:MAG: ABC transporter permease subunit [Candidatus Dormibacteria bacterium]